MTQFVFSKERFRGWFILGCREQGQKWKQQIGGNYNNPGKMPQEQEKQEKGTGRKVGGYEVASFLINPSYAKRI